MTVPFIYNKYLKKKYNILKKIEKQQNIPANYIGFKTLLKKSCFCDNIYLKILYREVQVMKKTRIAAFLILLAILVPSVIACSGKEGEDISGTGNTLDTQTVTDTSRDPEIPEGVTYDGYEFVFLVGTNVSTAAHIFESDAQSSDAIKQEIYKRNMGIEEKYDIKIEEYWHQIDNAQGAGAAFQDIQKACGSEDTLYDAAVASAYDCGTLAQNDYIVNLRDYGYIKLEKAWWDQPANEQLTIGGATYFTAGDISYIDRDFSYAIIFNKEMAKAHSLPDFYALVREGKWTYDQLYTVSKQVTKLDAVDGYSPDDEFGFLGYVDTTWMSFSSTGAKVAGVNEQGDIELTLYSEKTFNFFDKWTEFGQSEAFVNWQLDPAAKATGWKKVYQNGKALFFGATINGIYVLRDTETDYGFLPWPKYDADQEKYCTGLAPNHLSLFCIPNVGDDEHIQRTSILVTALSAESDSIIDAFYEKNLKGKSVRDDESMETLDIIFANRIFDLGFYYNVGGYRWTMFTMFRDGVPNFASTYAASEDTAKQKITEINALYKAVADKAN